MQQKRSKKTCFSCFHCEQIGNKKNLCYCLFDKTSEEDAELIYNPTGGECAAWEEIKIFT